MFANKMSAEMCKKLFC